LSLETAASSLLYYTAAYAFAGIAAFAVIIYTCNGKNEEDIDNFNGLAKSNPLMAAILTMSLLSMAGIPVFAGFFAKFMLFSQTITAGYLVVVIFAVINSIISIGYYFKLILAMYTRQANQPIIPSSIVYKIVAVISILINIIIGIYPSLITGLLK
jgi:NADH-quinone oxidoreductase subunit N